MSRGLSRKIGQLCSFENGHGFSPRDWAEKGLPIIRIQNLNGSKAFNYFDRVPNPSWIVEPGDILFAWAGVKGVSFGSTVWPGPRGVLNQHIYRIRPNPGVDRAWLSYALEHVTEEIESKAHGFKTSLLHVRKKDITGAKVTTPPTEERQRQVAATIEQWDVAIDKSEKLVEAKESHYAYELSRLIGRKKSLPSKHKQVALGDYLTESRLPSVSQNPAHRLTVRLHLQGVEARAVRGTESEGATTYFRRRAGQLIYGKQNIFRGAIGIVPNELDGYCSTQDLPAFDIHSAIDPQWLFYWLSQTEFYKSLEALTAGSGSKRLHPKEFLKLPIFVPDKATQIRTAHYLDALRIEISLLRQTAEAIKVQRRGLLQKLLQGRWSAELCRGKVA